MRRTLTALVVACALVVPAYTFASTGASMGASAKEPDKKIVTIGVIAPIDGGLTAFGRGIRNSVDLAVNQSNARNELPGFTLKVKALDDSSNPDKGALAAQQMVADLSVVAVVGTYNSGVALKALPVLGPAHLALLSPGNTLTSLTVGPDPAHPVRQYSNYFRLVGADLQQATFLAQAALDRGFHKVAVVSETKAVSKGLADEFADAFTTKGGTVVVHDLVPDGATDFSTFINHAQAASPDLTFFGGEYPVAATLLRQKVAAGLDTPVMGGDGIKDDALITAAGAAGAAGTIASTPGAPLQDRTSAAAFLAAYNRAGYAENPSDFGPEAYDAANAVIRTLVRNPAAARAAIVDALSATNFAGASGQVGFDAHGDTLHPTFSLYTVEGAAWVPAAPAKPAAAVAAQTKPAGAVVAPNTGTGDSQDGGFDTIMWLIVGLAAAAVVFAGSAVAVRNRR